MTNADKHLRTILLVERQVVELDLALEESNMEVVHRNITTKKLLIVLLDIGLDDRTKHNDHHRKGRHNNTK